MRHLIKVYLPGMIQTDGSFHRKYFADCIVNSGLLYFTALHGCNDSLEGPVQVCWPENYIISRLHSIYGSPGRGTDSARRIDAGETAHLQSIRDYHAMKTQLV